MSDSKKKNTTSKAKSNGNGKGKAADVWTPKATPRFLDPKVEFTAKGRIHGTGHRLSDDQKAQAIKLRTKDPETFTLRRLAVAFGTDPASMYYLLNGGRAAIVERNEKAAARAKTAKAKAKAAKASAPASKAA